MRHCRGAVEGYGLWVRQVWIHVASLGDLEGGIYSVYAPVSNCDNNTCFKEVVWIKLDDVYNKSMHFF